MFPVLHRHGLHPLARGSHVSGSGRVQLAHALISVAAIAVCFSGLMTLLSVLGRTEQAVGGSALAIILVMATLGSAWFRSSPCPIGC